MPDLSLTAWLRSRGEPCFRVYGKARAETDWCVIDVYATARRDADSRWPLWRGTCTTWTDRVIAVGWDFAESLVWEQSQWPASREHPVEVRGGRLRDPSRPQAATASEVMAHECGHTWQARRLRSSLLYLPLVGSVTLLREGRHFWNHFENQASQQGQFGGLVNGSVCPRLAALLGGGLPGWARDPA
jgi:hypothetical protein